VKTKSVLSYFGSDSEVAQSLACKLDLAKHVTIPFVGGGAILPWLKARAIVCNDKNALVINFYRVLGGVFGAKERQKLIDLCQSTLSHPEEAELAQHYLDQPEGFSPTLKAWGYWCLCWVCRKGKGGTKHLGGQPSVRWTPEGGTNATRIAAAAEDLTEWAKQFRRCEFTSLDWRDVLAKIKDYPQCGTYCDPPWCGSGRNYQFEFDDAEHRELAEALGRFEQSPIVVRYGNADLIRELYPEDSWTWQTANARNQANEEGAEVWISRRCEL
jgi:site-specific DNA-adenine methylase